MAVVDTFVRAIEASDFERRLKIMEAEYVARAKVYRKFRRRIRRVFNR